MTSRERRRALKNLKKQEQEKEGSPDSLQGSQETVPQVTTTVNLLSIYCVLMIRRRFQNPFRLQ
jgi:hypothetical protein